MHNNSKPIYLPLVVGVISPISLVLSLPPVFGSWSKKELNVSFAYSKTVSQRILLFVGLGCLAFGNLALLFKFIEKRSKLNTILAIMLFFSHTIFNATSIISFITTNHVKMKDLTGDFYATFFTSFFSSINSVLLIIHYSRFYKRNTKRFVSTLSHKQRLFVFFEILVTTWCILGGIVFAYIEDWTLTRGIYFTMVTMTTIGFGDFKPTHLSSKIILFFYALIGITIMGIFINSMRVVLVEFLQQKYMKRIENLSLNRFETISPKIASLFQKPKIFRKLGFTNRISESFQNEKNLENQQSRMLHRQLEFSILFFLVFWFFGALIFKYTENWTYFNAFYFCFVSFTTIGYGDITIKSYPGLVIFIGYMFIGLVAVAYLIFIISEIWAISLKNRSEKISEGDKQEPKSNTNSMTNAKYLFQEDSHTNNELKEILCKLNNDYKSKELDLISKIKNIARLYHYYSFKCQKEDMDSNELEEHNKKIEKCSLILEKLINTCDQSLTINEDM